MIGGIVGFKRSTGAFKDTTDASHEVGHTSP